MNKSTSVNLRNRTDLLNVKDYQLIRRPFGALWYRYRAVDNCWCEFTLLCEVGAPFQRVFQERLTALVEEGLQFITRPWENPPYMGDMLLPPQEKLQDTDKDAKWQLGMGQHANN